MFIRVTCPNGHALKVDRKFAGRQGVCPSCKAKVLIPKPQPQPDEISEDAILDVLSTGRSSSKRSRYAASRDEIPLPKQQDDDHVLGGEEASSDSLSGSSLLTRRCPSCAKSVPPKYTICPHCRTYLLEESQVAKSGTVVCPDCGIPSFPGEDVCTQCGARLFSRG